MFSMPTKKELKELALFKKPNCVTIYLPYSKPGSTGTNPNFISLKNLIREAEAALGSLPVDEKTIRKTLRPATTLLNSPAPATLKNEAVALFLQERFARIYKIPNGSLEPLVTIEYGFNLGPLERVIEDNAKYYLLALGHDNVRLLEGDHYGLYPVRLRNFPTSLITALRLDEYPNWTESHTVGPTERTHSPKSEAFHGQYNEREVDKDELLRFFRLVNERLHKFLHSKKAPLILAGVDYLIPIYKKANTYPHLAASTISGNVDHARLTELQNKAWAIIQKADNKPTKKG